MTIRQQVIRWLYPIITRLQRPGAMRGIRTQPKAAEAPSSDFYALEATDIKGRAFPFSPLRGKFVLVVNTASGCGFTPQYDRLEQLQQQYPDKLAILGFPSNDFGNQEPGDHAAIEKLCRLDYGVSFPIMRKTAVTGSHRHPVYAWLCDPGKNGWNSAVPVWNFSKYLVSDTGRLLGFFPPAVDPLDTAITKYLS